MIIGLCMCVDGEGGKGKGEEKEEGRKAGKGRKGGRGRRGKRGLLLNANQRHAQYHLLCFLKFRFQFCNLCLVLLSFGGRCTDSSNTETKQQASNLP